MLGLFLTIPGPLRVQADDSTPGQVEAPSIDPAESRSPTPTAAEVQPPRSEAESQARELAARAKERFEAGDYETALTEFTRAHDLMRGDPRAGNLLNNIAVCHERLFQYGLAIDYYERYLQEGQVTPEDQTEVLAVIRALSDMLGTVDITSNVSASIWVDQHLQGDAPRSLRLAAGRRAIELRAPGYQPSAREVQVLARSKIAIDFALVPLPEYRGIHRAYFWSGVALTGAALITAVGVGARAVSQHNDAQALAREDLLTLDTKTHVERLALTADVCFGLTALFAVGTTVLAFLTDFDRQPERPRDRRTTDVRVDARLDKAAASLQLGALF